MTTTIDQRIDRILKAGGERFTKPGGVYYGTRDWNASRRELWMATEEDFKEFFAVFKRRVAKEKASK